MQAILGLAKGAVRVVPHDPRWRELYEAEATRLISCIRSQKTSIEHIGSTAIPGLAAKPILDLMMGVPMGHAQHHDGSLLAELASAGYEHRPLDEVDGRLFFVRGVESTRTHNLSVCLEDGEFWRARIAFRNALRTDPRLAHEYSALKQMLAQQFPRDRYAYTAAKEPFIQHVLAGAARR